MSDISVTTKRDILIFTVIVLFFIFSSVTIWFFNDVSIIANENPDMIHVVEYADKIVITIDLPVEHFLTGSVDVLYLERVLMIYRNGLTSTAYLDFKEFWKGDTLTVYESSLKDVVSVIVKTRIESQASSRGIWFQKSHEDWIKEVA